MKPQHLGYRDYREFLASDYWKRRRAKYEFRHPRSCEVCGSTLVELHHKHYETLGYEHDTDLAWLCRLHHQMIHDHPERSINDLRDEMHRSIDRTIESLMDRLRSV